MSEQLSEVDDAQLERWAYGRASNSDEQARATEAANELQRRADSNRDLAELARSERFAVKPSDHMPPDGETDDAAGESSDSQASGRTRYRARRLLVIGVGGVTVAALAISAGILLREPPADPLAIFDREETQLDRNWTSRLEGWGYSNVTAGPRATEVGDGYVLIAARLSTVPDGRSTEWDSYCLFVASPGSDGVSWGLSERCIDPEKFAREGITIPERQSTLSDGIDTATWGPFGDPSFGTVNYGDDTRAQTRSVLDLLASPMGTLPEDPSLSLRLEERYEVLMGPRLVHEVPLATGEAAGVYLYLREGSPGAADSDPVMCMQVASDESTATEECDKLASALASGIFVSKVVDEESWIFGFDAMGEVTARPQ